MFKVKAIVITDITPPDITITTPPASSTITNSTVFVAGTASDLQSGVSSVEVGLDLQPMVPAIGTSSWSQSFPVSEGFHVIVARAIDNAGNASQIITSSFRAQLSVPPPPPPVGPPPPPPPTVQPNISIRAYGLATMVPVPYISGIPVELRDDLGGVVNSVTPALNLITDPARSYTVTVFDTAQWIFNSWDARPNPTSRTQSIAIGNLVELDYNARFAPATSLPPPPPGTGLAGTLLINSYVYGTSTPIVASFDISAGDDVATGVMTPVSYNVNSGEPFTVTVYAPAGYHFMQWGTAPPVGAEAWRLNPIRTGTLSVPVPPAAAQITFTAYFAPD